jgi:hypothetical protein
MTEGQCQDARIIEFHPDGEQWAANVQPTDDLQPTESAGQKQKQLRQGLQAARQNELGRLIDEIHALSRHRVAAVPGGKEYEVSVDGAFGGYYTSAEIRALHRKLVTEGQAARPAFPSADSK